MNSFAKAALVLGAALFMGAAHAAGTTGSTTGTTTGTDGTVSNSTTGTSGDTGATDEMGTDSAGSTTMGGTGTTGSTSAAGGTATTGTAGTAGTSTTGTSTAGTDTFGNAGTGTEVRSVQSALSQKGYDLSVDGIMGSQTRNALMRFQREEGLTESGQIDQETLRALNIESDRIPSSVPSLPDDTGTMESEDNPEADVNM